MGCERTHGASLAGPLSTSCLLFCVQSSYMPGVEMVVEPLLDEIGISRVIK
jgi:hypothetical protein